MSLMPVKNESSVEYNWLGPNAGIKVSNICYGAMTLGAQRGTLGLPGNTDEAGSHAILDRFVELGGNFIDTANVYSNGESEEIIGSWMSKRDRSSIVIATKVRFAPAPSNGYLDGGLSRSAILTNLDKSLKNLQTDYVDLYYSHMWDAGVKLEETLRTFNDVVRAGKVRYVGISNVTGAQLQKIVDYNKFMGFDQSVCLQGEYSLLERGMELEVIPTAREEGVSIVPYSPLKGGLLTGKMTRDATDTKDIAGTRLAWMAEAFPAFGLANPIEQNKAKEEFWHLMDTIAAIAKKHGKTQAQVALRWTLQSELVSSVIIGAKTIQQLEDNMGAANGWSLTVEDMELLKEASNPLALKPGYPYNFIEKFNGPRYRKF